MEVLHVVEPLIPLGERLLIDRAKIRVALAAQVGDEVAADETTGAADENLIHWESCKCGG